MTANCTQRYVWFGNSTRAWSCIGVAVVVSECSSVDSRETVAYLSIDFQGVVKTFLQFASRIMEGRISALPDGPTLPSLVESDICDTGVAGWFSTVYGQASAVPISLWEGTKPVCQVVVAIFYA